ncbi:TPA: hypothetical protein ACH3X2_012203 [Trebouxia sp. C0005]
MARRRVQYGVVNASDADVGTGAPGFRATWQSKDDLRQQVMKISDVPKNGKLYFWDGQLWLRWEDPDDLPGPEGDPLRIKIVCPQNAEPKLPNFEANFRQLLVKSRFNCPKEVIVNTIVRRLPARMIACSSVQQAADLFEDASCLPGASTAKHLMTQNKLTVNGPLYPRDEGGPSCLLRAMNASGRPCIVKLLDTRVSLDSSEQPGGAEAAAVRLVCDTAAVQEAVPVVRAELITLYLSADHGSTGHGPGKYAAIVMPQYCGSVAAQVQMSEAAIEAGAKGCYVLLSMCTQRNWSTWM